MIADERAWTQDNDVPPNIRPYSAPDGPACRALVVQRQEAERLVEPRLRRGEEIADEYLAQLHARCRAYDGLMLVAERAAEIVGLAVLYTRVPFEDLDEPPGDYAIVADLVVRDVYRGRGTGVALLRAAERYARDAGAFELRIGVLNGNQAARRIYVREGFAPYLDVLCKPLTS